MKELNRKPIQIALFISLSLLIAGSAMADGGLRVKLSVPWSSNDYIRFEGDGIPITVKVEKECFVTVIALDMHNNIRVIWPSRADYCNHLWAGESHNLVYKSEIMASQPGPVLIYAFAATSKDFRFHYQDRPVPFLDRRPYEPSHGESLFLTHGDRGFPLSYRFSFPRPVRTISRYEADDLAYALEDEIYSDYNRFVPVADRFLSWMQRRTARMRTRDHGSDFLDLYVAPWENSPDSYRISHRPYDRPVQFDPFTAYGQWITVGHTRVWQPDVWRGWRPFFNGYWTWTRHGWTWISYEPWGSVTDHYGYWAWHPRHHWIWIPGWEWKPAPVSWFTARTAYAWYPKTPPRHVRRQLDRECRYGDNLPAFSQVRKSDFTRDNLSDHAMDTQLQKFSGRNAMFSPLKNGPARQEVERVAGKVNQTKLKKGSPMKLDGKSVVPFTDQNAKSVPSTLSRKWKSQAPVSDQSNPESRKLKRSGKPRKETKGKLYRMPKPNIEALRNKLEK